MTINEKFGSTAGLFAVFAFLLLFLMIPFEAYWLKIAAIVFSIIAVICFLLSIWL